MIFNKTFLQTLFLPLALSCTYPPIEKKKLYYSKDKIEVFYQSRDILKKLGYEIDIFSPESFALSTKKTQIKKSLRKYDYIIFIKVNDNIELHLDCKFLHYRAATNWHSNWKGSNDPLEKKTKMFNMIIEDVLS